MLLQHLSPFLSCEACLAPVEATTPLPNRQDRIANDAIIVGCGKSVLAKHLVDRRGKALTVNTGPPTLCYFFFKDGDVERTGASKALCAFLHQLVLQQPVLYKYAQQDFNNKSEKFLTDFDALWNVFLAMSMDPALPEIVCVIDALDECRESSRLVAKMTELYDDHQLARRTGPVLKFLVTSRPDFNIVRDFRDLTDTMSEVRLRAEEESEQISREIDFVIKFKVDQLEKRMSLRPADTKELLANLSEIPQRTYLWLYLTFNDIEQRVELTKQDIAIIAKIVPQSVDKAYTRILDKSLDKERARKLLSIVLTAERPLTVGELNVAMVMKEDIMLYADLDPYLWRSDSIEDIIKNLCGLFVTVVGGKVYLIHQTAREFLLGEDGASATPSSDIGSAEPWRKSFFAPQAHLVMARICIQYLHMQDLPLKDVSVHDRRNRLHDEFFKSIEQSHVFLTYVARYWADHSRGTQTFIEGALVEKIAWSLCDPDSELFTLWSTIYICLGGACSYWIKSKELSNLHILAMFGIEPAVKLLLKEPGIRMDFKAQYENTPLHMAVRYGRTAVAKTLVEREQSLVNTVDYLGQTPLHLATNWNREEIVRHFIGLRSTDMNAIDGDGQTPLHNAVRRSNETMTKMLLACDDVEIDPPDRWG